MKIQKTKLNDYKSIIVGEYGYSTFEINKDNELILTFKNGQQYKRFLQVELTLPRVRQTTIELHVDKFYQWVKDNVYRGEIPE